MAGERRRLAGHALHHAAVAGQGVDVEVHQVETRAVVARGQPALRHGHAHAGGQPLAQRAGGGLHAAGLAELRVTGAAAVELAELLDVVQGDGGAALGGVLHVGQMEQAVEQHGGVPGREHETVAVEPLRVRGVVREHVAPEGVGRRRGAQGRARVAGVRGLDRVDGEGAEGVDGELVEILDGRHGSLPVCGVAVFGLLATDNVPATPPDRSRNLGPGHLGVVSAPSFAYNDAPIAAGSSTSQPPDVP